jgi:hypothetical protein
LLVPPRDTVSGENAHRIISNLSRGFADAREALHQKQSRSKEWYDSSVVQRLFRRSDIVRLRVHH